MITVYTKPNCSQCVAVKTTLTQSEIPFEEKPIDDHALALANENNWKMAPIIFDENRPELSHAGYNPHALQTLIDWQ